MQPITHPSWSEADRRPREAFVPNPGLRFLDQCRERTRFPRFSRRSEEACPPWVRRFIVWSDARLPMPDARCRMPALRPDRAGLRSHQAGRCSFRSGRHSFRSGRHSFRSGWHSFRSGPRSFRSGWHSFRSGPRSDCSGRSHNCAGGTGFFAGCRALPRQFLPERSGGSLFSMGSGPCHGLGTALAKPEIGGVV